MSDQIPQSNNRQVKEYVTASAFASKFQSK